MSPMSRLLIVPAVSLVLLLCASAQAADANAVARARAYVEAPKNGPAILNYVHMGSRYGGHQFVDQRNVQNVQGQVFAGYFAVVYRYQWEADGLTDVAFLCTPDGKIYDIQITWTNAVLNQPFLTANLTIQVLGNALLEAMKNELTIAQRQELQRIVDRADAQALLIWAVNVTQR